MTLTDRTPVGAPCWIDLFTADTDRARAFYGSLFGWTAEDTGPDFGGYINFSKDGHRVAGCMRNDGQSGTPDVWSVYLRTNDASATVAAGEVHGGATIVPAMAVGDLGSMAVVVDSAQAAIGMWQPGSHIGFGVMGQPGAPSWFELHTRGYDAAVGYYRDVFGWDTRTMSDTADFRYTTLGEGDAALAGIMDASAYLPDGAPSSWHVYFQVADADAAVASIVELGGAIVMAPEDTPYGRIAMATDPTGAMFKVMQPLR
jgi:predicted enzyme related to lactoylglutathione lyase